jgi:hypothetical protein
VGSTILKSLASFFPIIPSRYLETYLLDIKGNCFLKSQVKPFGREGGARWALWELSPHSSPACEALIPIKPFSKIHGINSTHAHTESVAG